MTLFSKLYLYFFLAFFCSTVLANDSITKVLPLRAHIDNEKFFSYKVTKFGFDDSHLIVNYNPSSEQFYSQSTNVVLETDIPKGFPAGFELTATKLNSTCENAAGDIVKSNFAHYWIEDEELMDGKSLHFDSFNNPNLFYLNDKKKFVVSFDKLPNFDVSKAYCKGAATLVVSLDF